MLFALALTHLFPLAGEKENQGDDGTGRKLRRHSR